MPWLAPVTMAMRSLSLRMVKILLIGEGLSAPADPRPRDRRAGEIGHVEFVEILAAESHVRRAAQPDGPAIPGEQGFLAPRADSPDLIGRVAANVEVAVRIERQAIGKPAATRGMDLRCPIHP